MIDTPELLQEQMKETKSQLSDKLETLDQQLHLSQAVQTTTSAVNASVEAVQATAATVTSAMQSVSDAFDIRRQMSQHPLMVLGGAVALGYVAHQLLSQSQMKPAPLFDPGSTLDEFPTVNGHSVNSQQPSVNVAATAAATRAYNETLMLSSPLLQLKSLALNTLIGIARESATMAVQLIAGYLTANLDRTRDHAPNLSGIDPVQNE